MTRRVESIQLMRGLAASLVLLAHALELAVARDGDFGTHPMRMAKALSVMGASGVDLFFVISGFVMAFSIERFQGLGGAGRFLVQRAIRIVPLYWLISTLFAAYLALSGAVPGTRSMIAMITILPLFDGRAFHMPTLGVGWTLSFEAAFYLLVAAATAGGGKGARQLFWLAGAAGVAGIFIVPAWAAARVVINPMMLEFAMGVAVFLAWRAGILRRGGMPLLLGGLIVVAVSHYVFDFGRVPVAAGAVLSSEFSLARAATRGLLWTLVVAVSLGPNQSVSPGAVTRVGAAIGDASYSIYLVHVPVMMLLAPSLATLSTPWPLFAAALFAAATAGGVFVHRLVEQPLLAWCRSFGAATPRRNEALAV